MIQYFWASNSSRVILKHVQLSYRCTHSLSIGQRESYFCLITTHFAFKRCHITYLQCYKTRCSRVTERKQVPLSDSAAIKTDRFNCVQRTLKKSPIASPSATCIALRCFELETFWYIGHFLSNSYGTLRKPCKIFSRAAASASILYFIQLHDLFIATLVCSRKVCSFAREV